MTSPRERRRQALRAPRADGRRHQYRRQHRQGATSAPHGPASPQPQHVPPPPSPSVPASRTSSNSIPHTVRLQAASMARRVLAAVEAGELDATGPKGTALVRQLKGAVTALEASAGSSPAM